MDKIWVIVWHVFLGGDVSDGKPMNYAGIPFQSEVDCREFILQGMQKYDRDKQLPRKFYVDCMRLDKIPRGLPSL